MQFAKWFRKYEKRILIIVTVLIAISFGAGAGLPRMLGGMLTWLLRGEAKERDEKVAYVLGEPIDRQEFIAFSIRWARYPFAGQSTDEVWSAYAAVRLAERLGIRVSDNEVRATILSEPAFFDESKGPAGRYSHERFQAVLKDNRMTQQDFEETLREHLAVLKLQASLLDAVVVTSAEVWQANWSYRTAAVVFPVEDFLAQVPEPGEEEVTTFYGKERPNRYREAGKIRIEVLAAPYERFASEVTVTDEEARNYYDAHLQEFVDLPAVQEGTEQGEQSVTPFEDVRDQILDRLRRQRARQQARSALDDARAKLQTEPETTLAAVAEGSEGKLKAITTDFFATTDVADVPILGASFGPQSAFVASLFRLQAGEGSLSEVGLGTEAAVVCRLLGRRPSRVLSLEEARQQVIDDVKRSHAAERARQQATELVEELTEKGLSVTSEEVGRRALMVETAPWFRLNAPDAPPYANQLLHRRAGDVLAAEAEEAAFVVEVLESRPPAWEDFQSVRQRQKASAQLMRRIGVLVNWDEVVRRETGLELPRVTPDAEPAPQEATEEEAAEEEAPGSSETGRPPARGAEPSPGESSQGQSGPGAP